MSAWQNKFQGMASGLTEAVAPRRSRRHFLLSTAPAMLLMAGTVVACGKKGDLEPPPRATKTTTSPEPENAE